MNITNGMKIKKVLIGSSAIKHYYPDFPRTPKDIDYAVSTKMDRDGKIEYLYNPIIVDEVINKHPAQILLDGDYLPTLNDLLTLKASHLCWDINWEKHLFDACFLIKKGAKINKELFHKLFDFWESYHGKRKSSDLSMTADDFFDNAINGKDGLDHDFMHTLIKDIPTYQKVLKDGSEVEPDENKFNLLPHSEKKSLFEEEVMVMAYERFNKIGYRHAFTRMLKKFIINHAPVWGVPFIVQNYLEMEKPTFNYYTKIENGIN